MIRFLNAYDRWTDKHAAGMMWFWAFISLWNLLDVVSAVTHRHYFILPLRAFFLYLSLSLLRGAGEQDRKNREAKK